MAKHIYEPFYSLKKNVSRIFPSEVLISFARGFFDHVIGVFLMRLRLGYFILFSPRLWTINMNNLDEPGP